MNRFNVGDRVAVYNSGERDICTVVEDLGQGAGRPRIYLKADKNGVHFYAFPEQCRLLKPRKELREFWIQTRGSPSDSRRFDAYVCSQTDIDRLTTLPGQIHVREVRKKK